MKKCMLVVVLMVGVALCQVSRSDALSLFYAGADMDGEYMESNFELVSMDPDGLLHFKLTGGGPSVDSDGFVYLTETWFGSTSTVDSMMDYAEVYGIYNAPYLYLFSSNVQDFENVYPAVAYTANILVLSLDVYSGGFRLEKAWKTIYLSTVNQFANMWVPRVPVEDAIYSIAP